ncbi:hypothetical protein TPHA_0C02090 [Tetrapisispora phaffii CBS 4417]|uniref:Protein IFH1 n=1 Tax=Tetrapisispora phaffii (strain ATCC 24235 / CBS 4417 / NBRC 1672 / NRRL Y-8282 / UCD 70-5) TaxID=1071381 RepID=G8BRI8_TETPH|nr:hypothetical protein TPHA_0C02090 [Tetrapisispora phaffii CBS 4417]CCE62364.1 hypothetical protein TPHA_0C02090 [Tetrapisispora phaffii CBS 4417]
MPSKNSPRKALPKASPIKSGEANKSQVSGKLPANIKQLFKNQNSKTEKSDGNLNVSGTNRPRRFSLLYSSDSSLSDLSDEKSNIARPAYAGKKNRNNQHHMTEGKKLVSGMFANATANNVKNKSATEDDKKVKSSTSGKNSKLIRNQTVNNDSIENRKEDEGTESSDYGVFVSADEDGASSSDDDDDDDDTDGDSDTSSEDENIDFVKLTAQRKKRAMEALSALKRKTVLSMEKHNTNNDHTIDSKPQATEDIGEEIKVTENTVKFNNSNNNNNINNVSLGNKLIEEFHIPKLSSLSESSSSTSDEKLDKNSLENEIDSNQYSDISPTSGTESDYDIDHDEFFKAIGKDDSDALTDVDTGIETGEDDIALLEQEEADIVKELQDDYDISFDGSVHEEGSDPEDNMSQKVKTRIFSNNQGEVEFDEDDFEIPFYEDPKFFNLYSYGDGTEPKLGLSTSLPLLLNDEKLSKLRNKQAKKLERKERLQRHKLLKKNKSLRHASTPSIDNGGDEYIFSVFFHSDEDNDDKRSSKKKLNIDSPLHHLGDANSKYDNEHALTSDDDNNCSLLDEARIPSENEDENIIVNENNKSKDNNQFVLKNKTLNKKSKSRNKSHTSIDSSSDGLSIELDDDDDDDDLSLTNVFIDIDDLDPDSFYFQYDDEEDDDFLDDLDDIKHNGSSYSDISVDDIDIDSSDGDKNKLNGGTDKAMIYVDDESTDEDDNLPRPTQKSKSLSTKAKEIVGSNVIGLRPPKLGTWKTNSKPFSIIDGLSTKSLYPLIQEHMQLLEGRANSMTPEGVETPNEIPNTNADELTLNELLNMSDLEDQASEDVDASNTQLLNISEWYNKPKVPLSAFRNKGVNHFDDDEYLIPDNSIKKFPIGYVGNERTRRKIARMKELQKKENEKRRKIKKKRKLLKMQRDQARKVRSEMLNKELASTVAAPTSDSLITNTSRKNSMKNDALYEIHSLLKHEDNDLLDNTHDDDDYDDNIFDLTQINGDIDTTSLDVKDVDILTSLTAPVELGNLDGNSASLWRRRKSIVEAAEENLRFTKNGLFSETALADIEDILEDGTSSSAFNYDEVLQ